MVNNLYKESAEIGTRTLCVCSFALNDLGAIQISTFLGRRWLQLMRGFLLGELSWGNAVVRCKYNRNLNNSLPGNHSKTKSFLTWTQLKQYPCPQTHAEQSFSAESDRSAHAVRH